MNEDDAGNFGIDRLAVAVAAGEMSRKIRESQFTVTPASPIYCSQYICIPVEQRAARSVCGKIGRVLELPFSVSS